MTFYYNYSMTEMEESLAGIHKLDFQQITVPCYYAGYEDPQCYIMHLRILQRNETKLPNLQSNPFRVTFSKMYNCYVPYDLIRSLYHDFGEI